MALPKKVKIGGSYFIGKALTVDAAAADYTLDFEFDNEALVNGMSVIPGADGAGDTFKIEHLDAVDQLVGSRPIAEDIPNVGAKASWQFDLSALERIPAANKLRLTYTNTAGVEMTVNMVVEVIQ